MAKKNEDERLDDNSILRVIKYLEDKKATKKVACQMLNISYNTARLDKLIEQFIQKKEADAKRRSEKRGTPATEAEVQFIITEYLEGNTIDNISKSLFRGTTFVKAILDRYHVPERDTSVNYFKPKLIPEETIRDRFSINENVWSARYNTMVNICKEMRQNGINIYRVWIPRDGQYAYQPAYELASLDFLRDKGIIK